MRICEKHWQMLRDGIASRGLQGLVSTSGDDLGSRIERAISGEATVAGAYDPLFSVSMTINRAALETGGLYLLSGDYCPICEAMKGLANVPLENGDIPGAEWVENDWINGPLDAELRYAQANRLVPPAQ